MNWQDKYIKAFRFAALAHGDQKIPGSDISYIYHLSLVCMEIIAILDAEPTINAELAVQAALLHDVLEDTEISFGELENEFGKSVASGVKDLTKNKSIDKPQRMKECLDRIVRQPKEVWMVKMADRITNLQPPPDFWDNKKRKDYREEAILIYNMLKDGSSLLAERLKEKIDNYRNYFSNA